MNEAVVDPDRCADLSRERGLAAGLAEALSGLDVAASAPGHGVLLPVDGLPAAAEIVPHPFAAHEGLALVRLHGRERTPSYKVSEFGLGGGLTGMRAAALTAVRVGVLRTVLDAAVDRLRTRHFNGTPLIGYQLVNGALADIVTELELHSCAAEPENRSAAAVWAEHERLTSAGWAVARFFGAEGYLVGHPVRSLHLSALAADLWLARPCSGEESDP